VGEVVKFRKPRNGTIRGAAREMLTEAMHGVGKPAGFVIVAVAADGSFAIRSAHDDRIKLFDLYSRAGALCDRARMDLIDGVGE
jgi:hypothetical protein